MANAGEGTLKNRMLYFGDKLKAKLLEKDSETCKMELSYEGNIYEVLDEIGQMPLPPYITEKLENALTSCDIQVTGNKNGATCTEFANAKTRGVLAIRLKDGDKLVSAILTTGKDELLLITRRGKALRYSASNERRWKIYTYYYSQASRGSCAF